MAGCVGLLLHYGMPQLRKQLPWLCIARPMLRSHEHLQYEVRDAAKIMWFEKVRPAVCTDNMKWRLHLYNSLSQQLRLAVALAHYSDLKYVSWLCGALYILAPKEVLRMRYKNCDESKLEGGLKNLRLVSTICAKLVVLVVVGLSLLQ